ncbi:hypothetical protein A8E47_38700 [Burkholderia cenocepacia]|nr:hypothetical protein A8D70_36370 [Burkholderia cenocepacia]ONO16162.1 hypothetical protein A8D69_10600 [Burkholderia cenocepacia]ONO22442.1 hypothetical protein A8D66_36665 [Burkholderia cenocepacia]ONO23230.1 hypothetical protein A8D71_37000 [Burkholderia cenocepacia]ONO42752.1 hypothetical protein A8D72_36610 [Burkholderia cenocepacia]
MLFRKALLHVRLLRKRTLLGSGWPCLLGAGHFSNSSKHVSNYIGQLLNTRAKLGIASNGTG